MHHIIHPAQHGFRSKRSCCSALTVISNNLSTAKNGGLFSAIAALDFSRAFDTIEHQLLLRKLANTGFGDHALSWFTSYLTERKQYVCYNGAKSDLQTAKHGVPQGSVMGPTLFLIYINDMFDKLPSQSVVAYADDVTLMTSGDSAGAAAVELQSMLDVVNSWASNNRLSLNPLKCSSMCIAPTRKKTTSTPLNALCIGGVNIPDAQTIKILGVIFSSNLDWQQQARSVRAKMNCKLGVLRKIGGSLNTRSRAHIYKACIKPHLDYCLPVWACCGPEQALINKTLERTKRIVTNCKTAVIEKSDFNIFSLMSFVDLKLLSILCHYFYCMHVTDGNFNTNISLLKDNNSSMQTRASLSQKAHAIIVSY
jgi:hypothetical protein